MELFAAQDDLYRKRVLPGGNIIRIGVEAGVRQGWDQWLLGERARAGKSAFIGMDRFGASAPAEELFEKFGITADGIVAKVKELM
jgi:transketolase